MLIKNVGMLVYVLEDGYFFLCANLISIIGLFVLISLQHAQQVFLITYRFFDSICLAGSGGAHMLDHFCWCFLEDWQSLLTSATRAGETIKPSFCAWLCNGR